MMIKLIANDYTTLTSASQLFAIPGYFTCNIYADTNQLLSHCIEDYLVGPIHRCKVIWHEFVANMNVFFIILWVALLFAGIYTCLLYTSPSPRD